MKDAKSDRLRQLQELNSKHDERLIEDIEQLQSFEDDIQFAKTAAISADDNRKAAFKLAFDEDQQIVAVSRGHSKFYLISRCLVVQVVYKTDTCFISG
jgi:hypothetical protein